MTALRDPGLGGLARLEVVVEPDARWSAASRRCAGACSPSALLALVARRAAWLAAPTWRCARWAGCARSPSSVGRGPGPRRAACRPTGRRSCAARRALQRDARAPGALGGGPRARAGGDAALRRRRRPRAAHAADQPARHALDRSGATPTLRRRAPAAMIADALAEQRRLVDLLDGLQALARGDAGPLEHARGRPRRGRRRRRLRRARAPPRRAPQPTPTPVADARAGSRACACWSQPARQRGAPRPPRREVHVAAARWRAAGPCCVSTTTATGMPGDERERIFEPFARGDGADRPGGLGLALVAQQARDHGATCRRRRRGAPGAPASPCASRRVRIWREGPACAGPSSPADVARR